MKVDIMDQSLHEYFTKHAENSGICYYAPVVEAIEIQQNEFYQGGFAEVFEHVKAPYSGFLIFEDLGPRLILSAEFLDQYEPIAQWLQRTDREKLGEDIIANAVPKGATITVHAMERSHQKTTMTAPSDGWIVHDTNTKRVQFMEDLVFRSIYDAPSQSSEALKNLYRPKHISRSTPIHFMKLRHDLLTRDDKGVPHNHPKGSYLIQIPNTLPREYRVMSEPDFFKMFTLATKLSALEDKQDKVVNVDFKKKSIIRPKM